MPAKKFIERAKRMVDEVRDRHTTLEKEEKRLRKRLNEIENERANLGDPDARMESYLVSGAYTCPVCFFEKGITIEMKPIGSDGNGDVFECSQCNCEI